MNSNETTRRLQLGAVLGAAALCLSACGGVKESAPPPPALSHSLGSALAVQSDAVASALAANDPCRALTLARQLQQQTIAAINEGHVAAGLQEQLSSAVNALVTRVQCVPPPQVAPRHDHGKHKGQHKQKGDEND
ncbi:MAG TPA: hypothetical protein VKB64_05890 [Gaiellaceae bacterium]|nr:hypothetical protein [Gaiellaceae bacterium]